MSTTEPPPDQPEGPVSDAPHMDPDTVRGPDEEELEWPEPQEDPLEEPGESKANDGTPGAVEEGQDGT